MDPATPPQKHAEITAALQKAGHGTALPDPDVQEFVRGLSPSGRNLLISLLGELFNVLDNIDVYCELNIRACKERTDFGKLRQMLALLNQP